MIFAEDGAELFKGAASPILSDLYAILGHLPADQAGLRLRDIAGLGAHIEAGGRIGGIAAAILGAQCFPVRALLFNKTADINWALGWHQDRTIAVVQRIDMPGYGPWTKKQGMLHVAPPFDLLTRMVTLRVHLDPVGEDNAPLLIAPGSHRAGHAPVSRIAAIVQQYGVKQCLADVGDIWLYATPILHASDAALTPAGRRVLQIDYAAEALPGGLQWLGV